MDASSLLNLDLSQVENIDILVGALNEVKADLQTTSTSDKIPSNGIPGAEILERALEKMKRKEFLDNAIKQYGEPTRLSGKYERYGWRPFGYKGTFVRAGSIEQVYEKAWQEHKKQEEEKSLTLSQAVEYYCLSKKEVKGSTRQKYRDNISLFLGDYLDTPLNKITALQIEMAYKEAIVEKKPHKNTVKGFRGTLEKVLKHVKKHYGQKFNYDIDVLLEDLRENTNKKLLKGPRKAVLFQKPKDRYTIEEAVLFIEEALRRNTLKSLGAALMFFTGCRISETCGSYKEDYEVNRHVLNVKHAAFHNDETNEYYIGLPKEEKERVVVYPDKADIIIKKILDLNKESDVYMFPSKHQRIDAEWMTIRQMDHEIADICDAIGIERKSAHDIRRTFDSMLDKTTMSSALRHLLVGHELTGIDKCYLVDDSTLEEVRVIMNKAFEPLVFNDAA